MCHNPVVITAPETVRVMSVCANRNNNHTVGYLHISVLRTYLGLKIADITINFFYHRTGKQRNPIVISHIVNNNVKIRSDTSAVYIVPKLKRIAA
jgi:hypothetical protein